MAFDKIRLEEIMSILGGLNIDCRELIIIYDWLLVTNGSYENRKLLEYFPEIMRTMG